MPNRNGIKRVGSPMLKLALTVSVFACLAIGVFVSKTTPVDATSSNYLNFQARLLSTAGAVVPDGNYNVEFKIYDASASAGSSQGSCAGDANCLWTETRTGGNKVRVVNGYLTVDLGAVTGFPVINWDQQLYLTMNIGGTGAASWDGEMSPRLTLTAVPYAFRAQQLALQTGANESTLSFATQTAANSILLPDEAGTLCIRNSANCGFAAATGSSAYIQNGTGLQTNANYNIQSAATNSVGAVIRGASGQTADLFDLQHGASGTNVVSVGPDGQALFQNKNNSSTAFRIQDASGKNYLAVDTVGASISVGDTGIASSIQVGNTTGAVTQTINIGTNSTASSTNNINIGSSIAGTTAITGPTTITSRTSGSATGLAITSSSTGNGEDVSLTNTSGTQTNGLSIDRNGAGGATTNLLSLSNTAGTATNAINITGTFGNNLINTPSFNVSNGGSVQANAGYLINSITTGSFAKRIVAGTGGVTTNDVVICAVDSSNFRVLDTTTARDIRVCGVATAGAASGSNAQVAFVGNVTVNADAAAVAIGDQLVTSTTSGAVTVNNSATNGILGIASSAKGAGAATVTVQLGIFRGVTNPDFGGGNLTTTGTYNTNTFNSSTLQFGAAGTATIDSASGQTLQIGTGANAHNVTIGNTTGSTGLSLLTGTGNFSLDGVGASTYQLGTSTTNGTIAIGGTAQTGTLTLGRSTATNTISIGASAGNGNTQTINIGNSGTAGSTTNLVLGSTIGGSTTIQSAGGLVLTTLGTADNNTTLCRNSSNIVATCTNGGNTLQSAYNASTGGATSEIILDTTRNALDIQDRSTSNGGTIGANLLNIRATAATDATAGATLLSVGNTGAVLLQNSANSANALQVQNAIGDQLLNIDTTNSNLITNSSIEISPLSNWTYSGTAGSVTRDTSQFYFGNASLNVTTNNGANDGAKQTLATTLAASTTYFISWWDKLSASTFTDVKAQFSYDGTTGNAANCATFNTQTVLTTGWTRHTCSFTTGSGGTAPTASNAIYIVQTAAAVRTFWIDGVQLEQTAATPYNDGKIQLNGVVTSPTTFQNTNNSLMAFQIQNAAGTSNLFVADTINGRIGIGKATNLSATLDVNGTVYASSEFSLSNATFGNIKKAYTAGTGGVTANDVVVLASDSGNSRVIDTTTARDPRVFGVVASTASAGNTVFTAIAGQATVNYTGTAPVIGDQLVTSTVAGSVIVDNNATSGVLGYAVSNGSSGTVSVMIEQIHGVTNPIFRNNSNSTNAFQVQNATGDTEFNIDTTQTSLLSNPSAEQAFSASNWQVKAGGETVTQDSTQKYIGSKSIKVITTGSALDGVKQNITLNDGPAVTYALNFEAKLDSGSAAFSTLIARYNNGSADTNCVTGGSILSTGWKRFSCTFSSPNSHSGTPYIYIGQSDANAHTFYVDAVQLTLSSTNLPYTDSNYQLNGVISSPVTFQNQSDSNTAFQIQNAAGTGNTFIVDTTNTRVGIGAQPSVLGTTGLEVTGTTYSSTGFVIGTSTSTGNITKFFTVGTGGVTASHPVILNTDGGNPRVMETTTARDQHVIGVAGTTAASTGTAWVTIYGAAQVNADGHVFGNAGGAIAPGDRLVIGASGAVYKDNNATSGIVGISQGTLALNGTSATLNVWVMPQTGNDNARFQNTTDNTTAFQVQNAAGNNYISVSTSGASVSIGDTGIASTIQVGNTTGAVAQTINIGTNATGSSTNTIHIGDGANATNTITEGSSSNTANTYTLEAGTGATAIQIGNGATAHGIQIGTGAAVQTIVLGSTNTTSATSIQGGVSGAINIGSVGSSTLASTTHIADTTDATGTQLVTIGSNAKSANTLTLQGQTINTGAVGSATTATAVHIADTSDGTSTQAVTIGSNAKTTNTLTLQGQTVSVGSIGSSTTATTVHIADTTDGTSTQAVTIGSNAKSTNTLTLQGQTVNVGTVGSATTATAVHIADTSDATNAQAVTIGSTAANAGNVLNLQGGTNASTAIVLRTGATGGNAGGITIGNTTGANTQAINIGTNATGSSTTNVTIGSTVAGTTTLQSAGGVKVTTLGTATSNSAYLCRDSSTTILTACNTTGTGVAFVNGGNSFGGVGVLGTLDANGLQIVTGASGPNGRAFFSATSNDLYFGNASTGGTAATPNDFNVSGTGSSTAGTTGGALTVSGGAGATGTTGSNGGALNLQGGTASGTNARTGGAVAITGGTPSATGVGGAISLTSGAGGSTSGNSGAITIATGNTTSGTAGNISIDVGTSTSGNGTISIGTASRAQTIAVGNTNASTGVSIEAGTGASAIQIGNGGTAHGIQIGTGAAVQTIVIGSTNSTSATSIQGGVSGAINIGSVASSTLASTTNIATTSDATGTQVVNIGSSAKTNNAVTIEAGNTGTIAIGNGATAHTINVGTGAAVQGITIGSTNTTSATNIQGGVSGAINVGSVGSSTLASTTHIGDTTDATGTQLVTIGSNAKAANTLTLQGQTVNVGSVGASTTATAVHIADTSDATGTQAVSIGSNAKGANSLTLDAGTGATAIQIGNGGTAHGIQIGTGAAVQTLVIGSTNTTSATSIQGGVSGAINIGSVASSTLASTTNIATTSDATGTQVVNIGSSAKVNNAINIQGGTTGGINVGTVGSATAGSTIHIADTSDGTNTQAVTIGSNAKTTNTLTLQGQTVSVGTVGSATTATTIHIADTSDGTNTQAVTIGSNAKTTNTLTLQGQTVSIGTVGSATTATTIHIADTTDATNSQIVTIGSNAKSTNVTSIQGQTLNLGAVGSATTATTVNIANTSDGTNTQAVNIGSNAKSTNTLLLDAGTAANAVQIGNSATAHGIQIGTGAAVQTIVIGSTNTSSATSIQGGVSGAINVGSVGSSTLASTTHIADTTDATGAQAVTIGSTAANAGNLTTLQGGTDAATAILLRTGATGGAAGGITIGNTTGANTQTINVGTNATGSSSTAVNIGSTVAGITTLQSAGGVKVITLGSADTNTILCRNSSNFIATCTGAANTLQTAYNASTGGSTSEIILDTTRNAVDIQDRSTSNGGTIGANLLNVRATAANDSTAGALLFGIGNTGAATFQNSANSSTAFQVQNATGEQMLNIDTTNSNLITNSGIEANPLANWSYNGTPGSVTRDTSTSYLGSASLNVTTAGGALDGAKQTLATTLSASTAYFISWEDKLSASTFTDVKAMFSYDGTIGNAISCSSQNTQTVVTTGWTRHSCTFTTGSGGTAPTSSNAIFIVQTAGATRTFWIDAVQLQLTAATPYTNGGIQVGGSITSPTVFQNAVNSTTAFQIQNAAGTGNIFVVDTINGRIGINKAIPTNAVDVIGSVASDSAFVLGTSSLTSGQIRKTMTVGATNVAAKDVVVFGLDGASNTRVFTSTTGRDPRVFGVAQSAVSSGSSVDVIISGMTQVNVNTGDTIAVGDQLVVSTTGGVAVVDNNATQGIIGYATQAKNNTTPGPIGIYVKPINGVNNPIFKNTSDGTTAFQIQNANGNNYLLVNTTGATISVGDTSIASTVQIGNTTGNVTQTINIGTNAAGGSSTENVNIGSSVAGTTAITGATTITNRTSGSADTLVVNNSSSTGTIAKFQDNGATVFQLADGGAATFSNQTNSASAFQVQNASAEPLINVDTTTQNLVTNGSFETNTTGWALKGSASIARITSDSAVGNASLDATTTAAANDGMKYAISLVSNTKYSLSFYAKVSGTPGAFLSYGYAQDGSTETGSTTSLTQNVLSNGWTRYNLTFTTATVSGSPYVFIKQSDATIRELKIDGVMLTKFSQLTNAGGELAVAGNWVTKSTAAVTQDSTFFYAGADSVKTVTTAANNDGVKQAITLSDSSFYTLSFYAMLGSASNAMATMEAGYSSDGSTDNTVCTTAKTLYTGWINYTCTFVTPSSHSGTPYIYIKQTDNVIHTFYIDEVQLVAGNIPNQYQSGTIQLNGVLNSPIAIQNATNSTTAFSIQNASATNVFNVDTTNGGAISVFGTTNGEVGPWTTQTNNLATGLNDSSVVYANGYIYILGGGDSGNTAQTTTQYAKVNADGSLGSFTAGPALPAGRRLGTAVFLNGYLYYMNGSGTGAAGQVYYTRVNPDGGLNAWQTNPVNMPQANRTGMAAFTYNGLIYVWGGSATQDYTFVKPNTDGSLTNFTYVTQYTLNSNRDFTGVAVANGFVYWVGGRNNVPTGTAVVSYAAINSDGTLGTASTTSSLPEARTFNGRVEIINGYLYAIGGGNASGTARNTVYYAKINSTTGGVGTWNTAVNNLPMTTGVTDNETISANGYLYSIGGIIDGSSAQRTTYYASTSRLTLGGSLDLVGASATSSTIASGGGSLVAGNSSILGNLNVAGESSFNGGATFAGIISAGSGINVQGSANATSISTSALSAPTGTPTVTQTGATGAAQWKYVVTAVDANGNESTTSATGTVNNGNATVSTTNYITVTFNTVRGASFYNIYRTQSGGTPSSTGLISSVPAGPNSTQTVTDIGYQGATGSTPVTTTKSGSVSIAGSIQGQASFVGDILSSQINPVGGISVNPTLGSGTSYTYGVTAVDPQNNETAVVTAATATGAATLDASHFNTIAWSPVPGAAKYKIYRTASSGTPATTGLIGTNTISNNFTNIGPQTFVDNGIAGDGSTAPSTNTTGVAVFNGYSTTSRSAVNNTAAFAVQNATSSAALSVDTTAVNTFVSNSSFENNLVTGWTASGTGASIAATTAEKYVGSYSMAFTTGTAVGNSARLTIGAVLSTSTTYTLSFYAKTNTAFNTISASYASGGSTATETDCAVLTPVTRQVITTAWTRFTCTITTSATSPTGSAYIAIKQSDSTSRILYIDGVQIEAGSSITTGQISNTGFETNTTGWAYSTGVGTGTIAQNATPYNGAQSMRLNITAGAINAGTRFVTNNTGATALAQNTDYILSFWAKSTGAVTNLAAAYAVDGTNQVDCRLNSNTVSSSAWTYYYCTISTDSTAVNAGAYITIKESSSAVETIDIDNVLLTKATSVSSPSAFQETAISLNGAVTSPTSFKNQSNSTTAFQIQNSAGGNLFSVDSAYSNVSILTNNSGDVMPWQTNSYPLNAARTTVSSAAWNGYMYTVGDNTTIVNYAKINSNGSLGTQNTTTALPVARERQGLVAVNGYLYLVAGSNSGTEVNNVYYAKIYNDGTLSTWVLSPNTLANARRNLSVIAVNGYIYAIGGTSGAGTYYTDVSYAKVNADGTTGPWLATTSMPTTRQLAGVAAANGYLYILGGFNGTAYDNVTYFAPINADGTIGSFQTTTVLPGTRGAGAAYVANGYIYFVGGATSSTQGVEYAQLNPNGQIGSWTASNNQLPNPRGFYGYSFVNGYMYVIGGYDGSAAAATVYYTSTSRISAAGSIDLVGTSSENLADVGQTTGGSITAGNGTFVGDLNVNGLAYFNNNVTVNKELRVDGSTTIKNVTGSTNMLQIQNAGGSNVFTTNTVNLIRNSNFEGGTSGIDNEVDFWAKRGATTTLAVDNTQSYFGQQSMKVVTSAATTDGVKYNFVFTPSTSYAMSFYIKDTTGTIATMSYGRTDTGAGAGETACQSSQTISSTWTRFTCSFTTGATIGASGTPYIYINAGTASHTFYVDGVQLEQVGSTSVSASDYRGGDVTVDGIATFKSTADTATVLQIQNSNSANLLSADSTGNAPTVNLVSDSGAEVAGSTSTTFPSSTWAAQASSTVARDVSIYNSGTGSVSVNMGTTANNGVKNTLVSSPATNTEYIVSFNAKLIAGTAWTTMDVEYSADNGSTLVACSNYNTQTIVTTGWTKVTCMIASTGATAVTTPLLIIRQTDTPGSGRTFNIDNASFIKQDAGTNAVSTIRLGGNTGQGLTLLTLDSFADRPFTGATNTSLLGSMYYDTTIGKIQCYEAAGWGTCGSRLPQTVTLNPEYPGAVLTGDGTNNTGSMTSDFCSGTGRLNINVSGSNCGTNDEFNYYAWTAQATNDYDIYVKYQLPSDFNGWSSDTSIKMYGWVTATSTDKVELAMFNAAGTQCGSTTTLNSSNLTWQQTNMTGSESSDSACNTTNMAPGSIVTFRIKMTVGTNNDFARAGYLQFTYNSLF